MFNPIEIYIRFLKSNWSTRVKIFLTRVEAQPVLLLVQLVVISVEHHVMIFIPLQRKLESHVGEHSVAVQPQDPLHIWTSTHEHVDHEQLHPPALQLLVQLIHVVVKLQTMETTVIDLPQYSSACQFSSCQECRKIR